MTTKLGKHRSADNSGLRAKHCDFDRRERLIVKDHILFVFPGQRIKQETAGFTHAAAEYDHFGVKQINHTGNSLGKVIDIAAVYGNGKGILLPCGIKHGFRLNSGRIHIH